MRWQRRKQVFLKLTTLFISTTRDIYSPVPNKSPPPLLIFEFFVETPFLIWNPPLIDFPDIVLQIFQRLLKQIVLFAKL